MTESWFDGRARSARRRGVHVLVEDPDLGADIAEEDRKAAIQTAIAPVVDLARGPWTDFPAHDSGGLGAMLLGAFVLVCTDAGGRAHVELLGPGDILSPWVQMGPEIGLPMPTAVSASVLVPGRLALLDRGFALRTARWAAIHAAVVHRLLMRIRWLSLQAAINSVPRVERRLECTLWHLAHRFGRVTPRGVTLQVPLTHEQLAQMVGAQRPSVSMAVGQLRAGGCLSALPGRRWILHGDAPTDLRSLSPAPPTSTGSAAPPISS